MIRERLEFVMYLSTNNPHAKKKSASEADNWFTGESKNDDAKTGLKIKIAAILFCDWFKFNAFQFRIWKIEKINIEMCRMANKTKLSLSKCRMNGINIHEAGRYDHSDFQELICADSESPLESWAQSSTKKLFRATK